MSICLCLRRFVVAFALCLVLAPWADAREPQFEVAVQQDVMVPMRGGVELATDVYLPARGGQPLAERLPVILTRLPYGKASAKSFGEYYAARGYAFVAQDTRGRFGSEGVWRFLTDDGKDGWDCAAWIGAQPWSNRKIGMLGTSYVGGTQHARPPHSPTPIPVLTVHGAAGAKANS